MSFIRAIKAGFRSVSAGSCPDWKKDLALIICQERDLKLAEEREFVPEGTVQYASEIITVRIQGKPISKTRYQWAQFECSESSCPFPHFPYRSYDTDKTQAVITHNALLDLVAMNKAHPELSLHALLVLIHRKYWT